MIKLKTYHLTVNLINIVLSIIAFFLGMRILLLFFSANPSTPVVSWILSVSSFLMIPFRGIVKNLNFTTGILDLVALITLLVYLVIGYLLISLVNSVWLGSNDEETIEREHSTLAHYHHGS